MLKLPIDQDEMLKQMASEAVKRGAEVRTTVRDLTLKSLQGRDVTLSQIKNALKSVTEGVNMGAAANASANAEKLLSDALAGMDDALLKAVEANRSVLQQVTGGDVSFEESKMKKALDELERYEDTMFRTVKQASAGANERLRTQWASAMKNMKMEGTDTGERVAATLEQYGTQWQNALRDSRTAATKVAHAMQSSYATLVGSALSGMSEGLKQGRSRGGGGSAGMGGGGAGGGGSSTGSGGSGGGGAMARAATPATKPAAKKAPAKKTSAKKTPAKKSAAKRTARKGA